MKKLLVANWKMNLSKDEEVKLFSDINNLLKKEGSFENLEIVLCPSFLSLAKINSLNKDNSLLLGAQDCFWEEKGSFTGEVSPLYLKDMGVSFVIIGHSERRAHLAETDEMVHRKVKAALNNGICPIICVGETFEERQEKRKDYVVIQQVFKALSGLSPKEEDKIIIAYEPVWVIGSGQAVRPEEAEYTNQVIRQAAIDSLSLDFVSRNMRFLYGGSIDEKTVEGFLTSQSKVIDGFLVGGASLKADKFFNIAKRISL